MSGRDGLVTAREVPLAERRRLLRAGLLQRVAPGVYQRCSDPNETGPRALLGELDESEGAESELLARLRRADLGWRRELEIRLLQWGPGLVVARSSAAALWRLDGFEPPVPFAVNAPLKSGIRHPAVRRVRPLEPLATVGGFDVTGVGQTLIELGVGLEPRPGALTDPARLRADELVELAVESALHQGLVGERDLLDLLAVCGHRRAGASLLHDVLQRRPVGAPATESYLETRGIQVLRNADIGPGERQVDVYDRRGRYIKRVDLVLAARVIVEFDGGAFHSPDRDHELWAAFVAAGYGFVPASYRTVTRHPSKLVAQVRDALEGAELGESRRQ